MVHRHGCDRPTCQHEDPLQRAVNSLYLVYTKYPSRTSTPCRSCLRARCAIFPASQQSPPHMYTPWYKCRFLVRPARPSGGIVQTKPIITGQHPRTKTTQHRRTTQVVDAAGSLRHAHRRHVPSHVPPCKYRTLPHSFTGGRPVAPWAAPAASCCCCCGGPPSPPAPTVAAIISLLFRSKHTRQAAEPSSREGQDKELGTGMHMHTWYT